LSRESGIPLYVQIRNIIKDKIDQGILRKGQQIPPENVLAKEFGVSRLTVRHGLEDLLQQGIIYKEHGLGTFVSPARVQANYSRLTSFTKDVLDQGKEPSAKLLSIENCSDRQDIPSKMGLPETTNYCCVNRVRYVDEKPVAIQHSYIPDELCPAELEKYDWEKQSLFSLMEQNGLIAKRAIEQISACLANKTHSDYLDVEMGAPLIYIERITFGSKGKPIEYVEMYNRPDRYECIVQLTK
jgi:GntR family transcriptional regulator